MNYKETLSSSGWHYLGKGCSCSGGLEKFKKGTDMIKVNVQKQTFIKVSGTMYYETGEKYREIEYKDDLENRKRNHI